MRKDLLLIVLLLSCVFYSSSVCYAEDKTLLGMYRISLAQNTIRYYSFGSDSIKITETSTQDAFPEGNFSKLIISVDMNTLSVNATAILRVNGEDTDLKVIIPALETGVFKCTIEVSINEDDLCCLKAYAPIGQGTVYFHPLTVFEFPSAPPPTNGSYSLGLASGFFLAFILSMTIAVAMLMVSRRRS